MHSYMYMYDTYTAPYLPLCTSSPSHGSRSPNQVGKKVLNPNEGRIPSFFLFLLFFVVLDHASHAMGSQSSEYYDVVVGALGKVKFYRESLPLFYLVIAV